MCQRCGTPPQYIEIELTENVVFEDVGKLSKIIEAIHAAGFGCAMDDFGSGYSSLNLIQNIPVDTIRLDKVFFRNGTLT
ncbi:MAG: EAL domain-containing protein [Bilophila wadsworthia]